jgi:hypothetical protein
VRDGRPAGGVRLKERKMAEKKCHLPFQLFFSRNAIVAELSEHVAERIFDEIKSLRLQLEGRLDGLGSQANRLDLRVDRIEGIVSRIKWTLSMIVAPLVVYGLYALFQHYLK